MNLKKYIPTFLKYPLIVAYVLYRCIARGKTDKDIKLNLAGVLPPIGSKKIVHGGKVKLLALRERFGDSWKKFNIAYFVSSGLPFAPRIWIKIYKLFGIKVVWNQNGVAYGAWAGEKETDINNLMSAIHLSDHVVYQTEFCKRSADKYLGTYKGPWSIFNNPVDTDIFKPKESSDLPQTLTLLTIGSHFTRERIIIPIEATRILKEKGIESKLLIVGRLLWKDAEADIANEIKKNKVESLVERQGAFLQEEAPEIYRSAHILVHMKYLDPCPTVVLEALSSGLPIIGSKSGGMPELVDEKSGILIPIEENFDKLRYPSPEKVAEAIMLINKDLPKWSQMARSRAIEKFGKKDWINKHEDLFKKLNDQR